MSPDDAPRRAARACVLATVAIVPLVPLLSVSGADLAVKQLVALALLALGGVALWVDARRGRPGPVLATPLDALVPAWLAVTAVAAAAASELPVAAFSLGGRVALGLIYVLTIKAVRTPAHVRALFGAVLLSALVVAGLGLEGYSRFVADGAPESARAGYLSTALFPHSYLAAQYLTLVFVGAVVLVGERSLSGRSRVLVAVALVPIGAYLSVVGSRGAILSVAGALIVGSALRIVASGEDDRRRRLLGLAWKASVVAGLAVGLAFVLSLLGVLEVAYVGDRLTMLFDASRSGFNYSRLDVWRHTLDMVADHVVLGVGPGHFEASLPAYHASDTTVSHAHNQFMQVLAESGVAGLAVFLLLLRQARRAVMRGAAHVADDDERRGLFHASVAALIAGLITFLWETPLLWLESGGLLLVLLALVSRAGCTRPDETTRPRTAHAALLGLVLTLAATGVPTWRYLVSTRFGKAATDAVARAERAATPEEADAQRELAVELLTSAEQAFPHGGDVMSLKARMLSALGRFDESLAAWRVVDERVPGAFQSLSSIGALELRLGRPAAALEPLKRAVIAHLAPEGAATYARLALALMRVGRIEEAWTCYGMLIAVMNYQTVQPGILLDAATALVRLRRHPLFARRFLIMYAELAPDDAANPRVAELSALIDEIQAEPPRTNGDA